VQRGQVALKQGVPEIVAMVVRDEISVIAAADLANLSEEKADRVSVGYPVRAGVVTFATLAALRNPSTVPSRHC
jgi:hypothetical protein